MPAAISTGRLRVFRRCAFIIILYKNLRDIAYFLAYIKIESITNSMPVDSISVSCSCSTSQAMSTVMTGMMAVDKEAMMASTRWEPINQKT